MSPINAEDRVSSSSERSRENIIPDPDPEDIKNDIQNIYEAYKDADVFDRDRERGLSEKSTTELVAMLHEGYVPPEELSDNEKTEEEFKGMVVEIMKGGQKYGTVDTQTINNVAEELGVVAPNSEEFVRGGMTADKKYNSIETVIKAGEELDKNPYKDMAKTIDKPLLRAVKMTNWNDEYADWIDEYLDREEAEEIVDSYATDKKAALVHVAELKTSDRQRSKFDEVYETIVENSTPYNICKACEQANKEEDVRGRTIQKSEQARDLLFKELERQHSEKMRGYVETFINHKQKEEITPADLADAAEVGYNARAEAAGKGIKGAKKMGDYIYNESLKEVSSEELVQGFGMALRDGREEAANMLRRSLVDEYGAEKAREVEERAEEMYAEKKDRNINRSER